MTGQRSVSLDILRIVACFWVLFHHWTATSAFMLLMKQPYDVPAPPAWLHPFLDLGFLGVDLFFILSGIVIGRSAIGRTWQRFGEARVIRLAPAYVAATVLTLVVASVALTIIGPMSSYWLSLTGLQWFFGFPTSIGPAWTLFHEVRFYIAVTIVLALFGGDAERLRAAVKMAVALVIVTGLSALFVKAIEPAGAAVLKRTVFPVSAK